MSKYGFLFTHPESADTDPESPCFEVVIGLRTNEWIVEDPTDVPKVCGCGKCANDWTPLCVIETRVTLEEAYTLAKTVNECLFYSCNSDMWLVVFVEGESPVSTINVNGGFR